MNNGEHLNIDFIYYQELGKKLSQARLSSRKSLSQVAKKIGVSKQSLDLWELGKVRIKKKYFEKLCDIYNLKGTVEVQINLR